MEAQKDREVKKEKNNKLKFGCFCSIFTSSKEDVFSKKDQSVTLTKEYSSFTYIDLVQFLSYHIVPY